MSEIEWFGEQTKYRCKRVASARYEIVARTREYVRLCRSDQRTDPVETITAELFPLCAALKFIGTQGPKILREKRLGFWRRPLWMHGVRHTITRQPHGRVLLLGTWNYPLFLTGVQLAQSLAAGNQTIVKPAEGCEHITHRLVDCFYQTGIPRHAITVIDSSPTAATQTIREGVDLVVLTGSARTGRKVLAETGRSITPAIMELSGCDAVIVHESADLDRVAAAVDFGVNFNGGATCIGPRRLLAKQTQADAVLEKLKSRFADHHCTVHPAARESVANAIEDAIGAGAVDVLKHVDVNEIRQTGNTRPVLLDHVCSEMDIAGSDLFAPLLSVIRVNSDNEAIQAVNQCQYRLAASIFGDSENATRIASQLNVGSVSINDLVVPSADPRVPFGGRGESGFGDTRGAEGLLAMTATKVISQRNGNIMPHLWPRTPRDEPLLTAALQLIHGGGLAKRLGGLRNMVAGSKNLEDPKQ